MHLFYVMLLFDVINQQKKGKINEEFINIFILFEKLNILYYIFYSIIIQAHLN